MFAGFDLEGLCTLCQILNVRRWQSTRHVKSLSKRGLRHASVCPGDTFSDGQVLQDNGRTVLFISERVAKWQSHWQPRRNHLSHKDLRCVEYFANPEKVGKELDGERTRTVRCQPVGVREYLSLPLCHTLGNNRLRSKLPISPRYVLVRPPCSRPLSNGRCGMKPGHEIPIEQHQIHRLTDFQAMDRKSEQLPRPKAGHFDGFLKADASLANRVSDAAVDKGP